MTATLKNYTLKMFLANSLEPMTFSWIDPKCVADAFLQYAPHNTDAEGFDCCPDVSEHIAAHFVDQGDVDLDQHDRPTYHGDLRQFSDGIAGQLYETIMASQAIQDAAQELLIYGYSQDQHEADERAMLQVL